MALHEGVVILRFYYVEQQVYTHSKNNTYAATELANKVGTIVMHETINLFVLPASPPNGPKGMGSGAMERLTSRPLVSFSDSGGLFRADFSSSNTSSTGG